MLRLPQLECSRFLALGRTSLWWMTPQWGCRGEDVPGETQFLLLELAGGGGYALLLPLLDAGTFRATLQPPRCVRAPSLSSARERASIVSAQVE